MTITQTLNGPRAELGFFPEDAGYTSRLRGLDVVPEKLYAIGDVDVLDSEMLAVIGVRRGTPYGYRCVDRFVGFAAGEGVTVLTGGARGIESEAIDVALACGSKCAVVLAGGLDNPWPTENVEQFQRVIDGGGVIVSERSWEVAPTPHMFRSRTRIIAALCRAMLVIEAGLPSGVFSTADAALGLNRPVFAIPGSVFCDASRGCNALLEVGAVPVCDERSFEAALANAGFSVFQPF